MKSKANEIRTGLQQFNGSETIYQIPLIRTRYTNGLKYLTNVADCFWLITDTSIVAKDLMNKSYFITIDFKRLSKEKQDYTGYEAEITYSDGNGNIFVKNGYKITDFPLNELRLFFVDNTLMLPSEYWEVMVYLNFSNLGAMTQNKLLSMSKNKVENSFGEQIKNYAREHHLDYDTLLEEEAIRNLCNFDYVFTIWTLKNSKWAHLL